MVKERISDTKISVIGLGKLGAPLAVTFASRGFKVIGVDVIKKNIRAINADRPHIIEPQYNRLLKKYHHNLSATTDYKKVIKNSDITFIVVPTPSQQDGSFSNQFILQAIRALGPALKKKNPYHLISIVSTVVPQSMDQQIKPTLEKVSGKKCGQSLGLCYNPTFIALGSVINDILKPDFIVIGQSDKKSGTILEAFWRRVCLDKPPICRMNFVNAEISKLALNTYITTKISYANMLSQLCQKLPGADVNTVTAAIGLDSRVGSKYLQPGPPYGGPCFPRDNRALSSAGKKANLPLPLAQATDNINIHQFRQIAQRVTCLTSAKGKVSILGLAYKENTNSVDEAFGIKLAQFLVQKGYLVKVFDSQAMVNARKILGKKVVYSRTLVSCLKGVDTVVITTRAPEFQNLEEHFSTNKRPVTIIDCWHL